MKLKDLLTHVPGVGAVIDPLVYASGEIGDAALFGYYAAMLGLDITQRGVKAQLRQAAAEWCLRKGTPTLSSVKKELGL